jgi:hypothetical protein
MIRVLRELLDRSAVTLDGAARVIGGQPRTLPTCGQCRLCEQTRKWALSAASSSQSSFQRATSEDADRRDSAH